MSIAISIFYDTRKLRKKTNDYPFKLRVYVAGEDAQLYHTVYGLPEKDKDKLGASNINEKLRVIRDALKDLQQAAEKAAAKYDSFAFPDFERDFLKDNPHIDQRRLVLQPIPEHKKPFDFSDYHKKFPILLREFPPGTIGEVYRYVITEKIRQGEPISTSSLYQASFVSLEKFSGNVRFQEVTKDYLNLYKEWMLEKPQPKGKQMKVRSKSTVGFYVRNLRHVFNEAIRLKIIKKEKCWPFGKAEFRIPSTRNVKKALEPEEINRLYQYECPPDKPWLRKAKAFWFWMLFGNGMNPMDILQLKYQNISGDLLEFERTKTAGTMSEDPPKITVILNDDMRQTIADYGNMDTSPGNYIFPYLTDDMTPLRRYEVKFLFIEFINKWMRAIMADLGIDKEMGCNVARQCYATLRRMNGASNQDIQDELGHLEPTTTQRYINSLPYEIRRKQADQLYLFKTGKTG